jgi:hypothetical protein
MAATIEEAREWSPFTLATMADCLSPDAIDSPGAALLVSVRDDAVTAWEDGHERDRARHEIADNAPDVYTHQKWREFVDLGAYYEEPEHGEWSTDLDNAGSVALYQIAERLVMAVWAELDEGKED